MSSLPSVDRLVVDSSVAIAWLFDDEDDPYATAVAARLPFANPIVPRLWHLEMANVLLGGERKNRCTQSDITGWLSFLARLPIAVDSETEDKAWSDTINLARQYRLTVYDAAYLELALREGIPLATLDKKLETAARAVGVPIYRP
jgi:predicted nucleic acid-binding protein